MAKIICEIASAHAGDPSKLVRLFDAAINAGSEFVKVQVFDFDHLVGKNNTRFSDLRDIELSRNDWVKFFDYSLGKRIELVGEFFDAISLERFGQHPSIKAIKIPISDLEDPEYRDTAKRLSKPIFLAASGALPSELDLILTEFGQAGIEVVLLLGFQSFPTRLEDSYLAKIQALKDRYLLDVGYADHSDANNTSERTIIPLLAMAAGASFIEKHITEDRSLKGFDHYSALNPDEFKDFVQTVKTFHKELKLAEVVS